MWDPVLYPFTQEVTHEGAKCFFVAPRFIREAQKRSPSLWVLPLKMNGCQGVRVSPAWLSSAR